MSSDFDDRSPEPASPHRVPRLRPGNHDDVATAIRELYVRVQVREERDAARLNAGAKKMAELDFNLKEVAKMAGEAKKTAIEASMPRPFPWKFAIPLVVGLAVTLASAWWKLAQYPDGERFERAQERTQIQLDALRENGHKMEKVQVQLGSTLEAAQRAFDENNRRLNVLIEQGRNKKR